VLAGGLVALFGLAVYTLFFSSWLVVDQVRVSGNATVSTDQVLTVAQVAVGEPLARLDTDAVSERIAAVPAVESVQLRRSWPHTLVITVRERQPALVLAAAGGFAVLDATGVAFARPDVAPAGVPLLRVSASAGSDRAVVDAVQAVVADLPTDLRASVVEVTAETLDSITLRLPGGVDVVWGGAEGGALKAQVLTELMKTPASLYNVSAPDVPAIRPLPTADPG